MAFNAEKFELSYQSNRRNYEVKFNGNFLVDGEVINTDYNRYDSPYAKAKKKDKTITFEFNGKSLFLDFGNLTREFS